VNNSKTKKLIIVGDSSFAEIAYEYFTFDSNYEVVAFSVEQNFLKKNRLCNLPVVPFEQLEVTFPPQEYEIFVAIVYTQLNRLRTRLVDTAKKKGYKLASYISSSAFVWKNVEIGEHCFIFENNTVQPFVKIKDNVILWSGNHIGHHSTIKNNCFISSQVVISGHCTIGESCFIGVNATLSNNVNLGEDNWLSPNVVILKDTENNQLYNISANNPSKISSKRFFKIRE